MQLFSRKGLTIIENIVSVAIVGVAMLSTVYAFASSQRYMAAARHHYQAAGIAREELEFIMAGEPANPRIVVIDQSTGLLGNLTVVNPTPTTIEVRVTWTEEMWTDENTSETIVAFLPTRKFPLLANLRISAFRPMFFNRQCDTAAHREFG